MCLRAAPAVATIVGQDAFVDGDVGCLLHAAVDGQVDNQAAGIKVFAKARQEFLARRLRGVLGFDIQRLGENVGTDGCFRSCLKLGLIDRT